MGAPFSFLRDKNDRAFVAWLQLQGVAKSVWPANSNYPLDISDSPIVTVHSREGKPEPPGLFFTGVWRFPTVVTVHARAARQPGEKNPYLRRLAMGAVFAAVVDSLMLSADGQTNDYVSAGISAAGRALATNNAPIHPPTDEDPNPPTIAACNPDMADYTCQDVLMSMLDGGNPHVEGAGKDTNVWKEAIIVDSICCSANVS